VGVVCCALRKGAGPRDGLVTPWAYAASHGPSIDEPQELDMKRFPFNSPWIAAAWAGCVLLTAPAAWAANVTALAYQNTIGIDQQFSGGAQVSATFGNAHAFASRSQVLSRVDGAGAGAQTHFTATAGSTSNYSLWDMGRNLPLEPAAAQQMDLVFNFELAGLLTVSPMSFSGASTRFTGGMNYTVGGESFEGAVSVSYGPVPPFPAFGYIVAGDGWLFGGYAASYSARHRGASGGIITFIVSNTAFNGGTAQSSLTLASVAVLGGAMPPGGLGIRIAETGLIVPASPVPELATWATMGAGLLLIAAGRLRRKQASA